MQGSKYRFNKRNKNGLEGCIVIRPLRNQCEHKSSNDGLQHPRDTESKRAWNTARLGIKRCDFFTVEFLI